MIQSALEFILDLISSVFEAAAASRWARKDAVQKADATVAQSRRDRRQTRMREAGEHDFLDS